MVSRQDLLTDNFISVAREVKEQQTARMAGDSDLIRRIEDMKQIFMKEIDDVRSVFFFLLDFHYICRFKPKRYFS